MGTPSGREEGEGEEEEGDAGETREGTMEAPLLVRGEWMWYGWQNSQALTVRRREGKQIIGETAGKSSMTQQAGRHRAGRRHIVW